MNIEKYIGKKWTNEKDCGYWFRKIQKDEFDRVVPVVCIDHAKPLEKAKAFKDKIPKGWHKTDKPKDGDAAFLSQRLRPHHIGTVIFVDDKMNILHALTGSNMVLSDRLSLKINNWKIESFWTYDD